MYTNSLKRHNPSKKMLIPLSYTIHLMYIIVRRKKTNAGIDLHK